jgi:hypothetical protein
MTSMSKRQLTARPDVIDFRDLCFTPTLVEVPQEMPLEDYLKMGVPVLDQGVEGACTGFGLATVANYLLLTRKVKPDAKRVSPRMLYEMARRYDEWPGSEYEGSSARGAMKGWHKHGVCAEDSWRYQSAKKDAQLTPERAADALLRPLGAYFRVNHRDLVAMHAALAEVGILYATAIVHDGWERVKADGLIPQPAGEKPLGGHAFAIVGYDQRGFWMQNSWGRGWGCEGYGHISYDDWLQNASDVWVARLGVPVTLRNGQALAALGSAAAGRSAAESIAELRPHVISIGNEGLLREGGSFSTTPKDVAKLFEQVIPEKTASWKKRRILLYAHGGLVSEQGALQRVADLLPSLLAAEVYPVSFIWKSDYWTTLKNILADTLASRRGAEAPAGGVTDFLLDRVDDGLEVLARHATGKASWDEMKENARLATENPDGGARWAAACLAKFMAKHADAEVHLVGHSAGSIFHGPLLRHLTGRAGTGLGVKVASATLWAPACTIDLFKECYQPALEQGRLGRLALYTLSEKAEEDDHCARIYNKSLLYLVSHAFEKQARIPLFRDGEPILGMAKFLGEDQELRTLFTSLGKARFMHAIAPNHKPHTAPEASGASAHGAFDNDPATLRSTLRWMLGAGAPAGVSRFVHRRNASSYRQQRAELARALR